MKNILQYIIDDKGNKLSVILPLKEYQKMVEEIEEPEDIRLYNEVKKREEESISFEQYLQQRNKKKDACV